MKGVVRYNRGVVKQRHLYILLFTEINDMEDGNKIIMLLKIPYLSKAESSKY